MTTDCPYCGKDVDLYTHEFCGRTPKAYSGGFDAGKLEGLRIQHEGHDKIWNDALEEAAMLVGAEEGYFRLAEAIRALKRPFKCT